MKVLLICQAGLSTGIMKEKIKEAAINDGVILDINAVGLDMFESVLTGVDFILLGPQIKYAENMVRKAVQEQMPIMMIDAIDFGRMQGDEVYHKMMKIKKQGE